MCYAPYSMNHNTLIANQDITFTKLNETINWILPVCLHDSIILAIENARSVTMFKLSQ